MSETNHNPSPQPPPPAGDVEVTAPAAAHHAPNDHSHVPTRFGRRTGKAVAALAAIVAIGLTVAYVHGTHARRRAAADLAHSARESADRALPVNVARVQHAPADNIVTLPGEARAFYETVIFARTSGYLSKWLVDIGDRVKEGQVLATIDSPELDDQLAAARARVEQLKAEVQVAKANAAFAKVSADRWTGAAPEGAVSAQERDQKKSELDSSLAKLEAAKAQVTLADADVQRLLTLEKFRTVLAPYAGTITQRHVDVGALVTAGSTNNTSSLFTISQSDQIRVFVEVPQPAVSSVKVGMPVTAHVAEYPDHVFAGKVDRTAESMDPVARTLRVQVLVPNDGHLLLPGMYAEVTFTTSRAQPPVRIPAAALCLRPSGPQVAVIGPRGHVHFRGIKIGRDLGDFIEVSAGLTGDETVALNLGTDTADGSPIDARVIQIGEPAPVSKPTISSNAAALRQ